jgi:serine/threonine-protein kinase RsbW
LSTTEGIPSQATPVHAPSNMGADMGAGTKATVERGVRDVVTVRLPATAAYLAVIRTTTASLAARLDFTLDEIEDLRIAVDEACCLLLADAAPEAELTSDFEMADGEIRVAISTHTAHGRGPARESFAWTVLSALAGHVDATVQPDGRQTITLVKRRTHEVRA